MQLGNTGIQFDEVEERLKVTIPVKRQTLPLGIYTVLAIVWLVGLIAFVFLLFNPLTPRGVDELPGTLRCAWYVGVLLWLYIWIRTIGRMIFRWWQFYLADREILFIDEKTLVVRRPVSIFGITDAYDREHTAPFYFSDRYDSLAFQYGNVQHIIFGTSLNRSESNQLLAFLNQRFYPFYDEDDDDEDEDY